MSVVETLKTKKQTWELLAKPKEEQVAWLMDNLMPLIQKKVIDEDDRILQIKVVDTLAPALQEALNTATLPEPEIEGELTEADKVALETLKNLDASYQAYLKTINVISESEINMSPRGGGDDMEKIIEAMDPSEIFIQVTLFSHVEHQTVMSYLQGFGFFDATKFVRFSPSEIKTIYGVILALSLIGRQSQTEKVIAAPPGMVKKFS